MSDRQTNSIAFVATGQIPQAPPPVSNSGIVGWLRENLFSSVANSIMTIIALALICGLLYEMLPWFLHSTWNANSLAECREFGEGACFAVIRERWNQFTFGFYPQTEYWRPVIAFVLLFIALAPILFSEKAGKLLPFTLIYPFIGYWLIWGGSVWAPVSAMFGFIVAYFAFKGSERLGFPLALAIGLITLALWSLFLVGPVASTLDGIGTINLEEVISRNIGGFLLTILLGVTAIIFSLPLGILLALGRQSNLIVIKTICVVFIEFIRGVPLITLLFVASVLLAYFLPPGTTFDLVLRVVIMVTLFASAYIAEVIRGGLAALPRGQYEAADALGLDYWQATRFIIMPQALKISIPSIVNVFIGLYKDTVLVAIISMYDPVGLSNAIRADSDWNGIIWEIYGFIGLFFFISCYGMSRYSQYLERKLNTSHR